HGEAEIGFLDTPGLHRPRSRLGRAMNRAARTAARAGGVLVVVGGIRGGKARNRAARTAAREADVLVMVVAIPSGKTEALAPHPEDERLLRQLPKDRPVVLVINKIDRLRGKGALVPRLDR